MDKKYYKVTEEGRLYTNTVAKTMEGIVKGFERDMGCFYDFEEETVIDGVTYYGEYKNDELPVSAKLWLLISDGFVEEL